MINSNNFFALIVAVVAATSGLHTTTMNLCSSTVTVVRWVVASQASPRCQHMPPASRPTDALSDTVISLILTLIFIYHWIFATNSNDINIAKSVT
ncbi:hypothetical protein PF005_g23396 [Phytophthora fragariae]|uniref:Uncharacterized protein n=1 Tax=Phytophthora fragariae TaxID=53985 RepID=A0A6A3Z4S1_9STRA|nr:hypothetical protein PF009_g2204 [Phytophthora fragariae]KAE8982442.1 hypothetical protein PF011_g21611 [Phytophthora fragariae]KAE9086051.1 hypothetical protein PF010_g20240 [Phytophthora fragariae]KAE9114639.1 hypothetical protein PF006_g19473 [Phytophthora fragariae]KAE9137374.1 hypothetical protein PF007_g1812 [Phytophthora fragariae]